MRKLRIAIDIDNTLINYEELFSEAAMLEGLDASLKTKNEIKNYIKDKNIDWPDMWIRVQGQCYGNLIKEAPYYKKALLIISILIEQGHHIELVSHKSKKSFCDRFDLHQACLERIGNDFEIINFFETRKEKTDYVNSSSFDLMIDDLDEVLDDIDDSIIKIHFNNYSSSYLQARNWSEIETLITLVIEHNIQDLRKVGKQTFQFNNSNKILYLKKFHSEDRYNNELRIIKNFNSIREASFIYPKLYQQKKNILILEDTETVSIQFNLPFVESYLKAIREINDLNIKQSATHAVLQTTDFLDNIENRLKEYNYPNKNLLTRIFDFLKEKGCDKEGLEQIICQPDMLKDNFGKKDNILCFFDFESFGKDALIRPVLNAIHHNGHKITHQEALNLFEAHLDLANDKAQFKTHFFRYFDHNALEWLIIMSNKAYSKNDHDFLQLVQQQTDKMIYNLENGKSVLSWKGELYDRILESI